MLPLRLCWQHNKGKAWSKRILGSSWNILIPSAPVERKDGIFGLHKKPLAPCKDEISCFGVYPVIRTGYRPQGLKGPQKFVNTRITMRTQNPLQDISKLFLVTFWYWA